MSFADLSMLVSIIMGIVGVIALLGSIVVFLGSRNKATGEAQARLIETLNGQIAAQERQIHELQREVTRSNQVNELIIKALSSLGLKITIDGTMVSVRNSTTGTTLFADASDLSSPSAPAAS